MAGMKLVLLYTSLHEISVQFQRDKPLADPGFENLELVQELLLPSRKLEHGAPRGGEGGIPRRRVVPAGGNGARFSGHLE